jgi:F420H(2)-dependent quinone reductase
MTSLPTMLGRLVMRAGPAFNAPVAAMARSTRFGGLLNRNIVMLSYVGRRSGRSISIPVAYRRAGEEFIISANMPETKTWWRNFLGDGGPLTLRLNGTERAGHGVAHRDEKGRVTIAVQLTPDR